MKKLLNLILDIIFPLHCFGCQREGFWLCEKCFQELPLQPSFERFEKLLVFSVCDYENIQIKKIIKTCKFSSISELSNTLGKILIKGILKFPEILDLLKEKNQLLLIPIPLSPKRQTERGFNQSLIIAQELSAHFQIPICDQLKKENRLPQSKVSVEKRGQNIQDAFSWHGANLNNYQIILVDDVVTTGATLSEASKILKKYGAKKIIGFAVAR